MNKHTHENRMQLAFLLTLKSYENGADVQPARDADQLGTLGKRANNAAVALCNGWIDQETFDRRKERIARTADQILTAYPGLKASVGGDPRGYAFYILGLPGNTLGGDEHGFGVN